MSVVDVLRDWWPLFMAGSNLIASTLASGHALVYKRDSRAAIGWVGIIWLVPIVGVLLYVSLGVNRIKRRALALRSEVQATTPPALEPRCSEVELTAVIRPQYRHLVPLIALGDRVTDAPLLSGNRIGPLLGGREAYPTMLEAIHAAKRSVLLATYIFGRDQAGQQFVDALGAAVARGIEVRVLIDAVGARYSWPSIVNLLRIRRIPTARFLPTMRPWHVRYSNLRNHRKLLIVDGTRGFTGGMNIRAGNLLDSARHGVQDLHFAVHGPVVSELRRTFAADWLFAAGETLEEATWFPPIPDAGPTLARGIADGPDEDIDKLRLMLLGALSCARSRVQIVTPYFLPDATLISALNTAALKGVRVDVVLPLKNNLTLVHWAAMATLWQILQRGCRVWLSPPPFDHTKLMVVDGMWTLVGSGNWDPRSLRLNFEFNVECWDPELADQLSTLADAKIAVAKELTLADVDGRRLPVRLRDGLARLLTPYL